MFAEAITVALAVSAIGTVIAFLVATLIKVIFLGIRLRETLIPKIQKFWNRPLHPQPNH